MMKPMRETRPRYRDETEQSDPVARATSYAIGAITSEGPAVTGMTIGVLAANLGGAPEVDFPGNPLNRPVSARTIASMKPSDVGRSVVLFFEDGDPLRPIILGLVQSRTPSGEPTPKMGLKTLTAEIEADGEKLLVAAKSEIVLRCGKASITLTKAGKILIRGEYVLSHSNGLNRVRGGAVHIN